MKKLTNSLLKISFAGIEMKDVQKIEFAFSQNKGEPPKKIAEYPSSNASVWNDNVIGVKFTPEDTKKFEADKNFYMDTRITMKNSPYQPETKVVKLFMNDTLFEEVQA